MPAAYPRRILDHYRAPRNKGPLPDATHEGKAVNPLCGDEMVLRLRVEEGRIVDARFEGVGCAVSQAAGSVLTETWRGQRTEEAVAWGLPEVLEALDAPVSPARERCALLPVEALRDAVQD